MKVYYLEQVVRQKKIELTVCTTFNILKLNNCKTKAI